MDSPPNATLQKIHDVACTMCGCVCDDLVVELDPSRNKVSDVSGACSLARPFFLDQRSNPNATHQVNGSAASLQDAINQATTLLAASKAPLIYGLSRSSTSGQRSATRLADQLGAVIDTTASRCHAPSIVALQQVGESTCTLGEARHHCDLVVFWGSNPQVSHPRHGERYSLTPPGQFLGGGRDKRHVVVIDVQPTETSELADELLQIPPGSDLDVIWTLRCLIAGLEVTSPHPAIDFAQLQRLAQRMKTCRSGIAYFGLGLTRHGTPHANVEALLRLVTDLNQHTRFYARRMRIPGDVAGADSVLCWQTGYPFSVNLARGYPRYNPGEYSANDLLERHEVDTALLVGSEGVAKLSPAAQKQLSNIPTIALDYPGHSSQLQPNVAFTTSVYGVHAPGTAYRMDETPIPLRPFLESDLPTDANVLDAIRSRLAAH